MIKHQHHFSEYCAVISNNRLYNELLVQYCKECGKIKDVHFFPNKKIIRQLINKNHFFKVQGKEVCEMEYIPEELLRNID